MKLAGYILSVYLLLLAIVPCCLVDYCPEDNTEQSGNHEKGDEPACPADRDCGSCSPFFSCEGCAAATVSIHPVHFELSPAIISPVYAVYKPSILTEAHSDFWQPPRLA